MHYKREQWKDACLHSLEAHTKSSEEDDMQQCDEALPSKVTRSYVDIEYLE